MPCNDQTEILHLWLDNEYKIKDYKLVKLSCLRQAGSVPGLLSFLAGRSDKEILQMSINDIKNSLQNDLNINEQFLCAKHFEIIKDVLLLLGGNANENILRFYSIHSFDNTDEGIYAKVLVRTGLDYSKNPGCGQCKGCKESKFKDQNLK